MKKFVSTVLLILFALSCSVSASAASIVRSSQNLFVDGREVYCDIYNIDGSNYFKLRDIAYLLNGTVRQFSVDYDNSANAITVTTGNSYSMIGGEVLIGADLSYTAQPSKQSIYIDGALCDSLSAYNIGGNNFFKLRDLGAALGFAVDYDNASRSMLIKTKDDFTYKSYSYSSSWYNYDVIVLSNNTNRDCKLTLTIKYMDSAGALIDAYTRTVDAFSANSSTCVYTMPDFDYASATYDIRTSDLSYYRAVTNNLSVDYDLTSSSVVGTVTNNGNYAAQFVQVTTLFFSGEKCVDMDWCYATDDDSEIKPGSSEIFKCETYGKSFDRVEIYLDARARK